MQVDITKLLTNREKKVLIDNDITISKELLTGSLIDDIKDIKIKGTLTIDEEDNIIINANLKGTMILKDDITLEPVEYSFNTDFEETTNSEEAMLDITDIIWQNILTEVPSKIRKSDKEISLSGDGWRMISEEEYEKEKNSSNNPFANLSELLEIKEDK